MSKYGGAFSMKRHVTCSECKAVVGHYCVAREAAGHDIDCVAQFHGEDGK